jgi:chromosome segregation ATPase
MRLPDGLRRLAYRLAGREPNIEDERLFELFRNRAELKKELHALDDERHRLLDRLKLQEGSTMRVEEQFAALEQYLGRPDEGYKSLAYYQLRSLWRTASQRLEKFAAELTRQQKDRERRAQLADFERQKRARMAEVERELSEARVLADQLQAEQKLARQRLEQSGGIWHYFRRRKLTEAIEVRNVRIDAAVLQVTDLGDQLHAIEAEPGPVFDGISVDGRRAINLAVIAYAEMIYDRLSSGGLADMARQSTLKRVYDAHYGGQADCLTVMQRAAHAVADLERLEDDLADIKTRADRIRRSAAYKSSADVVPLHDSLAASEGPVGARRPVPNLLLDEYWDIYRSLVR